MDTIYDAKLLIVDDNAELLKAAPLPVSALRQSSRS